MTNEKFNYCAIIETTLTNQKGEKRTFFPETVSDLENDSLFLTMTGHYDDGTAWTKKIDKKCISAIDIKGSLVSETEEE